MSLTFAGNKHRIHKWRMIGSGIGANDMWIRPTDIPIDEADELRKLYNLTNGNDWTDNTNWGKTSTANNWHGITVAGGKVTQIQLQNNNLNGDATSFDPSVFTTLTHLLFYINPSLQGNIWGSVPSTLQYLTLDLTGMSGDSSSLVLPASLRWYHINGTTISNVPDLSNLVAIQQIRVENCVLSQANVDKWVEDLYTRWLTGALTYATPSMNIAGTNAAPSGIYQNAAPPTTGKEFIFKLVNDPDGTGFPTWTITYNP